MYDMASGLPLPFLSTPSARRATKYEGTDYAEQCISIHALREEGDTMRTVHRMQNQTFLSTPSARRATIRMPPRMGFWLISIHALREEGDSSKDSMYSTIQYFYPRPPRGGRQR